MSNILLHGAAGSPFVRKVQIVLSEKGLAYEHVPTIPVTNPPPGLPFPGITPELRPRTPLGKIPFARVGDRWLADSSVIIAYASMQQADAAPDPTRWPNLARYIQQQLARPTIARLIEEEFAVMVASPS
jgi:glutathione S-transferase